MSLEAADPGDSPCWRTQARRRQPKLIMMNALERIIWELPR